jgi:secreted trypsin-like serine protease
MDGETPAVVSIVVGDWQRSAASSVRQTLSVDVIKSHESYNSRTYENDISLVKLTEDIVFSEDVRPVCAPDPANDYVYYKSQCSGWGSLSSGGSCCPDILRYVTMNITTNAYCDSAYTSYAITSDMICATDNIGSTERDSCQGDSGGPLTIKEADGTFRVIGVVSWGIGCASRYPGVYSRVSHFADWVSTNIGPVN